ncbi:BTAD domain-containing putative transcriptional regulator [Saccharothrix saharensis]|uniref:AfsR/SARP family transcriptional regulator n=1 Tax=Saccharothrix saharensis TaxID=571190 RepID=UPI0036BF1251
MGSATTFRVLGPLEVWRGDVPVPVPAGRARLLLAVLLLNANRPVSVDELVDRLWDGGAPNPDRARATLQMVVRRLRQALGESNVVRTATNGYLAEVPPDALDLDRFRALVAEERFGEALALWRGDPLSDVLRPEEVAPLLEERLAVLERRVEADLEAGRAAELVPELRSLTREHPLRERFWAALVPALHRSGRTAEALAAYQEVRTLLADELGVDPGERLRDAYEEVLGAGVGPRGRPIAPRQLPADVRSFTGRHGEIAELDRVAGDARVVAITGMGGLGKTALAVHWAHRAAAAFPDGQLVVNLRGYDHDLRPLTPGQALTHLLGGLGVAPERIPLGLDDQVALYRSVVADRRTLVVLDNAADVAQVRPLLPPGAGNFTVITGRDDLRGLVALDDAVLVRLAGLAPAEAVDLLRHILGPDRVDAEPDAIADLVRVCAGLPLALRVAAATLTVEPGGVADYVAALRSGDRLAELEIPGDLPAAVRSTFNLSYRKLTPTAQRLFRLLGVTPCRDFTAESAAALSGVGLDEVRSTLGELLRAHLLEQHRPGRYALHDLLRLHAEGRARTDETGPERDRAVDRLLDFYLHNVDRADRVLRKSRTELPLTPLTDAVPLVSFPDRRRAVGWLDDEFANLRVLIGFARERGRLEHAWQLPTGLWGYLYLSSVWAEWSTLTRIALDAARLLGNRFAEAVALHTLGSIHRNTLRGEEAVPLLRQALEIREEIGHEHGIAVTLTELASAYQALGRYELSVEHGKRAAERRAEQGDLAGLVVTLNNYAGTLLLAGDPEQALEVCLRAVALSERMPDQPDFGAVKDTLAQILAKLGRLREAADTYRAILAHGTEAWSGLNVVRLHANYADLLLSTGDPDAARTHLVRALDLSVERGLPHETDLRARLAALGVGANGARELRGRA